MQTHTGRTPYEKEAKIVVIQLQVMDTEECQQPPGEARRIAGQILCVSLQKKPSLLTLDTSSSKFMKESIFCCCFKHPKSSAVSKIYHFPCTQLPKLVKIK